MAPRCARGRILTLVRHAQEPSVIMAAMEHFDEDTVDKLRRLREVSRPSSETLQGCYCLNATP